MHEAAPLVSLLTYSRTLCDATAIPFADVSIHIEVEYYFPRSASGAATADADA
jgi:hypothetical protein